MAAAVPLRGDFSAFDLRRLARFSRNAGQSRRLSALAVIFDGGRGNKVARVGAVGLQAVRDWVLASHAAGPAGLIAGKALGQPCKLDDARRRALAEVVEQKPDPEHEGVVRWRLRDPGGVASRPLPDQPGRNYGGARVEEAENSWRCRHGPGATLKTRWRWRRSTKELSAVVEAIRAKLKPVMAIHLFLESNTIYNDLKYALIDKMFRSSVL